MTLQQLEERYIREVLRWTRGHRTEAARILGINRKTLLEKRKRYRIP
jgi:DNA-binding protein Fis